jgi:8-oxo-dGTP diphosphatase
MSFPEFAWVILRHGSHFFFIQRSVHSRHWPLHWGFPGGKREDDEDIFRAAQREIQEETGVEIDEKDIVSQITISANYIDGERRNTLFLFDTWQGNPENLEPKIHSDIGWFTLDDLPEPMISHVREWLFSLLDGKERLDYDGIWE